MERDRDAGDFAGSGAGARDAAARLIVCEPTGRWAVALRRELGDAQVRVWETRTLSGCWEEVRRSPASFVIVQLTKDVDGVLHFVARLARDFPAARAAILSDPLHEDFQWLMREAGAVDFADSLRAAQRLARLACRHLAEVPPPPQGLAERIWAGLPWG